MEREATMLRWVNKLEHQLESARHKSQDQAAEATGAWAVELLMAERATAALRGLDVVKVHLAETEAVL